MNHQQYLFYGHFIYEKVESFVMLKLNSSQKTIFAVALHLLCKPKWILMKCMQCVPAAVLCNTFTFTPPPTQLQASSTETYFPAEVQRSQRVARSTAHPFQKFKSVPCLKIMMSPPSKNALQLLNRMQNIFGMVELQSEPPAVICVLQPEL